MTTISSEMRIYAPCGARLYINEVERCRFLAAAEKASANTRSLCLTLAYTGCRISEALTLTPASIQAEACILSVQTLKQRRKENIVIREVPVPRQLIDMLIAEVIAGKPHHDDAHRLFPVCRETAWRQVKMVMAEAGISGLQATAKGLRHGFGIWAQRTGVPLNMIQKWMGHVRIETTTIHQSNRTRGKSTGGKDVGGDRRGQPGQHCSLLLCQLRFLNLASPKPVYIKLNFFGPLIVMCSKLAVRELPFNISISILCLM